MGRKIRATQIRASHEVSGFNQGVAMIEFPENLYHSLGNVCRLVTEIVLKGHNVYTRFGCGEAAIGFPVNRNPLRTELSY